MTKQDAMVRTRFAPSPTGYLHVGGARTALFSYLYARHHAGQFMLRIEDTDRERSTDEAITAILEAMQWLGLEYDEELMYQTQHSDRYNQALLRLLAEGKAYYCNCSKEHLEELRARQMAAKHKPRYDGCCRDKELTLTPGVSVVRFRNPQQGQVSFTDLIRGKITVENSELDDLVIARADGTPTYNFTVVVDDADMRITQVIRGDDHINNTPRQINLFKALALEPPQFAHVPMILGSDGKRLSKRHGAVSVLQYRDDGYLPEALLNYLVRLGWAHGDQEIFSKQEMITLFSLSSVSKSAASFSDEKLQWLNQHYLKTLPASCFLPSLQAQFSQVGVVLDDGPALESLVELQKERCKSLCEMVRCSRYFYEEFEAYDEKAAKKQLKSTIEAPLQSIKRRIEALTRWDQESLHQVVIDTAEEFDLKLGKVAQPLRVALTGSTVSPPIDATLLYIGRDRVLARIERALQYIAERDEASI